MELSKLAGPIIGSIIGYGTNWIAIKMLFRPLKPVKIGRFILPFTPGIIPKRKNKLAKAIGQMVGNNLFTRNDIEKVLLSEEIKKTIVDGILAILMSEESVKENLLKLVEEEEYFQIRENLKLRISEKIQNGLIQLQIGEIIAKEGGEVIRDKVKTSMLRMLITDSLIDSILNPIGSEIEKYIQERGQERLIPVVDKEMENLENTAVKSLMNGLDREKLETKVLKIYQSFVINQVNGLLEKMDIAKIVEEKVNKMEVLEVEKLLLSVMKKELGAIVNLGAVIGFILGSLNLFW